MIFVHRNSHNAHVHNEPRHSLAITNSNSALSFWSLSPQFLPLPRDSGLEIPQVLCLPFVLQFGMKHHAVKPNLYWGDELVTKTSFPISSMLHFKISIFQRRDDRREEITRCQNTNLQPLCAKATHSHTHSPMHASTNTDVYTYRHTHTHTHTQLHRNTNTQTITQTRTHCRTTPPQEPLRLPNFQGHNPDTLHFAIPNTASKFPPPYRVQAAYCLRSRLT